MSPLVLLLCMINNIESSSQPNVLFILADDFGWANAGYHRNPADDEVVTPNIDQLATKEGLQLNRH